MHLCPFRVSVGGPCLIQVLVTVCRHNINDITTDIGRVLLCVPPQTPEVGRYGRE